MDRWLILAHLKMAVRHLAESRKHVARQRALVIHLQQEGHDTTAAETLLEEFEISLHLHEQGMIQIKAELAAHDASNGRK